MNELLLKNLLMQCVRIILPLCVPLIVVYIVSSVTANEKSDLYIAINKVCRVFISCWWALLLMLIIYFLNPIFVKKSYAYESGTFMSFFIITILVVAVGVRKIFNDSKKYSEPIFQLIRNFTNIVIGVCVVLFVPFISQLLILLAPILIPIFALNLIGDKKIFNNIIFKVIRLLIWLVIFAVIIITILIVIDKVPLEYRSEAYKIKLYYLDLIQSLFFK